jgi:N-acetylmuramoyl-L-alanine amidase
MKNSARLAGLALVFLCFAFITAPVKKTIVIDAGHGGDDHGAMHDDLSEKQLVQNIANKIKSFDTKSEIEIILLREEDVFMSLEDRVTKINELHPDLLISLHVNYSQNRSDNGVSAFVSQKNANYESSRQKAEHLVSEIAGTRLAKNEIRTANLYVLNHTHCAGMLLELGYLTNDNDRAYISSEAGQNEIAKKIVASL